MRAAVLTPTVTPREEPTTRQLIAEQRAKFIDPIVIQVQLLIVAIIVLTFLRKSRADRELWHRGGGNR